MFFMSHATECIIKFTVLNFQSALLVHYDRRQVPDQARNCLSLLGNKIYQTPEVPYLLAMWIKCGSDQSISVLSRQCPAPDNPNTQ